jgi:hypothetical protein
MAADAPQEDEGERAAPVRVRWGVNAKLGAFVPQTAVVFGIEARAGVQLGPLFALYADLGSTGGFGIGAQVSPSGTASGTLNLVGFWHLGVNAELMLGDHFYLALGPHFASASWMGATATASSSGGSATAMAAVGPMPALDFRLGFMTGAKRPNGARRGFSIGLDVMTLFAFNALYGAASGSGSGGSAEGTRGLAVGVTPTLTLGFDAM